MSDNTLKPLQHGLENTVTNYRATLAPNSRAYCKEPEWYSKGATKKDADSEEVSEENHRNANDLYVVNKIIRHNDSGPASGTC